jgi:hypothetical protein
MVGGRDTRPRFDIDSENEESTPALNGHESPLNGKSILISGATRVHAKTSKSGSRRSKEDRRSQNRVMAAQRPRVRRRKAEERQVTHASSSSPTWRVSVGSTRARSQARRYIAAAGFSIPSCPLIRTGSRNGSTLRASSAWTVQRKSTAEIFVSFSSHDHCKPEREKVPMMTD